MSLKNRGTQHSTGKMVAVPAASRREQPAEIRGLLLFLAILLSVGVALGATDGLTGHWVGLFSMGIVAMAIIGATRAIARGYAKLVQTINCPARQADLLNDTTNHHYWQNT